MFLILGERINYIVEDAKIGDEYHQAYMRNVTITMKPFLIYQGTI